MKTFDLVTYLLNCSQFFAMLNKMLDQYILLVPEMTTLYAIAHYNTHSLFCNFLRSVQFLKRNRNLHKYKQILLVEHSQRPIEPP